MKHMKQAPYPDEPELITRVTQGDTAAFEIIYYQYCPSLKAFAYYELRDEAMAEDAVHDVFLKLWLKRDRLDAWQSIRGFLFTCLKNHLLNLVRTRRNELLKNRQAADLHPVSGCATEQAFTTAESIALIQNYLSSASEKKQAILRMSLFQGLSHDEIASRCNLSVNTIKMYLSHSSREIKSIIKDNS